MKLFADTPVRRTLQVVADILFVAWLVLWVWIGTAVHDGTEQLAAPARQTDSAATAMADQLRDAGDQLGEAPLVGEELSAPFDRAAEASDGLAAAPGRTIVTVSNWFEKLSMLLTVLPPRFTFRPISAPSPLEIRRSAKERVAGVSGTRIV